MGDDETTQAAIEKEDDEEYGDESSPIISVENSQTQSAIDITAQYVYERLNPKVVSNLVLISLVTLPDEMPAAFQSSYTPIAAAGTESQIRHLSRMIATQLTNQELGPGVDKIRLEKRQQFIARQAARIEGAIIPPTPMYQFAATREPSPPPRPEFIPPSAIRTKAKTKVQFGLLSVTKELKNKQAEGLILHVFRRILANEKRAVQGGAGIAQQKLLVRFVTRFEHGEDTRYEDELLRFIVQEQKSRTDLALFWIAELYAQFLGLFHKILLEAPLLTPQSLEWLRTACLDRVSDKFP
ncbi:unnamed protein product [Gongylonema pulchrum]|uniref:Symplekin_C domain-containing protein n=1 Tax=Gongylonema pulchrum TaxID=637853 RepID=A0A183D1Q7_9BILA|nr:unnamed protein product [Gongylonema pulchrum]